MRSTHRVAHRALTLCVLAALAGACGVASSDRTLGSARIPTRVDSILQLGDSIYRQSPESAAVLWRTALALAEASNDSSGIARAWTGLGMSARLHTDYPLSRRLGEQALALKLRLGMRAELPRSYNALGLLALDEERLTDALSLFERTTQEARALGDSGSVARAAINTGLVLDNLGNFGAARRSLELGRDVARAIGDSVNLGRALTNIARLDIALGDPLAALTHLEQARRLFRATGDSVGEVNALGQVATARDALGELPAAFAALDSAQRLANRLGFRREEAENLTLIGDLFNDAGDYRHALDYYARALAVTDSLGLPEERGNILRSEARAHARLGNSRLAMSRATAALRGHEAGDFRYATVSDRLLLAELAQEMGNGIDAERHLGEARRLGITLDDDVIRARVALTDARVAIGARQWARALRTLDAGANVLPLLGHSGTADALALRARAHTGLNQLDLAASVGAEAIAAVERIRGRYQSGELRTSYASAKSSIYVEQALLLLLLGREADAFRVADAARGRALLEHLANARADVRADDPARFVLEKEELLRRIDALVMKLGEPRAMPRERTAGAVALNTALTDSLVAARNAYEALLARASTAGALPATQLLGVGATPADVQRRLAPNEALIEYFVTPSRLLVFVVSQAGLTTIESRETAANLSARVRLARDLIRTSNDAAARGVLRALHSIVLAPVESTPAMKDITRLVVVPHGVLTYLPFAALLDPRTNQYAIQRYTLLHASTASAFVAMRSAERDASALEHTASVFAPFPDDLPATRAEAESFLRAIPTAMGHVGRGATENELRRALESRGVVHVATHAAMNAYNPLFSRVELVGDPTASSKDDGRLEIHEVLGLRAVSSLVFLSGCETALGIGGSTPFDAAEDYTTIGQALLYAGAKNVIATLWRIDDDAAAVFAARFYEALGTSDVAEALATAQRRMIGDVRFGRPYAWAAYQVSGSGAGRGAGRGAEAKRRAMSD